MRISINSPVRKAAFLGGSIAAAVLAWGLCWQALAEHVVTRAGTLEGFEKAARIQPLNANHLRVIGVGLVQSETSKAIATFEQSARINPHSALTWLELSRAYGISGQQEKQHKAITRALAADPKDVDVQWDASLYLIQNRDVDGALTLIRELISNDPTKAVAGMQAAYNATGGDASRTLAAIPPEAAIRVSFMRWLVEHGDAAAADQVWHGLSAGGGQLHARDLGFYIDSLIARHETATAKSVWGYLQANDADVQRNLEPGNLIVNGDFEANLLNSGLGWRYTKTDGVAVSIDTSTFHSGTRSLALQFDGNGVADAGIFELVPVEPNTRYSVRGFTHSEELESANGIRLAVTDYYSGKPLTMGDEILGSTAWRETSGEFTTDPDTTLVKICIVRSPAVGRIRGTLWVDDLHLEPRR